MIFPNPIADYDRVPYKFLSGAGRRLFFLLATGLYKFLSGAGRRLYIALQKLKEQGSYYFA